MALSAKYQSVFRAISQDILIAKHSYIFFTDQNEFITEIHLDATILPGVL